MRRYYFKSKPNSYCYQTFSLYFFQCTSRLGAIPSSFHHRLCCCSCSLSFVHLSICIWRPRICIFVLWSFELIVKAALAHCSLLSLWVVGKVEYELNEVLCVSNVRPICFDLFPKATFSLRWYFNCDRDICPGVWDCGLGKNRKFESSISKWVSRIGTLK